MIPQVVAATDLLSFWSPGSPRDGEDHIRWIPVPSQDPSTKRYGSTSGSPSACVTSRTCWRNAEWRCPTRSSALDESLRTDDRGRPTKAWPEAAYDLAPRWGLSDNRWSYGLSLAGRRRRRRSPRRAGPIQAKQASRVEVDAQTFEEICLRSPSDWSPTICDHTALPSMFLDRALPRARAMEEQSSREFSSTSAAAGAQDAAVQEPGFGPEIPVNACRRLQHLQRPTSSHLSSNAPRASRCGDGHMADRRRSSLKIPKSPTLRARPNGNVTIPT
jgi:hypothetical protein